MRRLVLLVLVVLALSAGSGSARSLSATVGVYPSGTTFSASAAAPAHAASSVTVAAATLPQQNEVSGSLLTAFNFSPQSYANKVSSLYGVSPESSLPGLFSFLASYRISPTSWGYGNPNKSSGYTSDRAWWRD